MNIVTQSLLEEYNEWKQSVINCQCLKLFQALTLSGSRF